MIENRKILVILPTYQEVSNLETVIIKILKQSVAGLDILVVDDNSPDGTGKLADQLSAKYKNNIFVLHRKGKNGLGSAYLEGFAWATKNSYEIVCEMDADGSHDPKYLKEMFKKIKLGVDLVIASRRVKGGKIIGWHWHRHLISWGATTVAGIVLNIPVKDITAGYRAYSAKAIKLLLSNNIESNGYAFQEETLWQMHKNGLIIEEIPTVFTDRKFGESKLSPKDSVEFFKTLWRIRVGKI